jgi:hypothetical protein
MDAGGPYDANGGVIDIELLILLKSFTKCV